MVRRRIPVSNSPADATTRPEGSTNALMPETAAFTYHRPVSIARICDICRCCALAAVEPYEALFTGTTTKPAPSSHARPRDRRERVLEADRRAERRQSRARQELCPLPRHPVDGDLVDRVDPPEPGSERDVLAEGHQVGLVVAIHLAAGGIQLQDRRVLTAVRIVDHRAHDRRSAGLGDDPCHGRSQRRGRRRPRGRGIPHPRRRGRAHRRRAAGAGRCSARPPARPRRRVPPSPAARTSTWIVATSTACPVGHRERQGERRGGEGRRERDGRRAAAS